MAKILQLDPHVADLIAAGEVVERPGSVIKELIENSIDAGATSITVEIRGGGMTYMRVTDNGCGIAPDDAKTAFFRHATSKLHDKYGLESIATLGFRGEALAAISAVSRIEMLSCETEAAEGIRVEVDGGTVVSASPAGCPEGTTMVVRDLFFNTPARQKFMKTDRAEGANISGVVLRCALSHPEISIKYIKDGSVEYHTPGDGMIDSCIYSLLGRDFAKNMLKTQSNDDDVSVTGFISAPHSARGNRGYQFFFVNGRFVKSKTLQAALEQAYKNSLFTGKFPACVLYITLRPSSVDVNVHPAKVEVKFLYERQVFDAVYYAALSALQGETQNAEIKLSSGTLSSVSQQSTQSETPAFQPRKTSPDPHSIMLDVPPRRDAPFKTSIPAMPEANRKLPVNYSARAVYETAQTMDAAQSLFSEPNAEMPAQNEEDSRTEPLFETDAYKIIGETLSTYIVVEAGDSLWLIDKHAAHERINFDKLKAAQNNIMTQILLVPIICRLGAEDCALLCDNSELLSQFGFEIDQFDDDTIALRQIPSDINEDSAEPLLGEIAGLLRVGHSANPEELRDGILHSIACKAAIKAGKNSHPQELEVLAARVISGEIKYCPHGRPVAIELTKNELDKNFKRI